MNDHHEPVSAGPRGRSGAAARNGRASATPRRASAAPRRTASTPAAGAVPSSAPEQDADPALPPRTASPIVTSTVPTSHPPAPSAAPSEARRLLEERLSELHPDTAAQVAQYRPRHMTAADWAQVADLARLGVAAYARDAPTAYKDNTMRTANWAFATHAAFHFTAGTNRTVAAWYSPDAVEATLRSLSGADRRSLASHARKLRVASAKLLPHLRQAQPNDRAYDPHGPYSTPELESFLDHAANHPKALVGKLLATLIWVGVGAGPFDREMRALTGTSFSTVPLADADGVITGDALVVDLPGDSRYTPRRRVAVHRSCEAPLAALAATAGETSIWPGLHQQRSVTETIARQAGIPKTLPNLTSGRLRATWLALMVGTAVPVAALLPAAGTKGDRSFGYLLDQVVPMPEAAYLQALRGTDGPLAALEGRLHDCPAPVIPLRSNRGGDQ